MDTIIITIGPADGVLTSPDILFPFSRGENISIQET